MNKNNPPQLTHGGDWAGYQAEFGPGARLLDFSANVSPLGVPEGIRQAIARESARVDRYPDPLCRALGQALAEKEGCEPAQILCGNGAADLIWRAVLAVRPRRALIPAPTFAEYEGALTALGCQVDRYFLKREQGFRLGEDFLLHITEDTDMVFLCEPNNPTGVTASRALRQKILEKCRRVGALFVEDDCFEDFLDDPAGHSWQGTWRQEPNLLILKAFTKLYAMAGVRLGYCLCGNRTLLEKMAAVGQPWNVSSLAQAAGVAALREEGYVSQVRALIRRERPWLSGQLAALGLEVVPAEANYILFRSEKSLLEPMRRRGIVLRSCGNYPGLDGSWYRCAVRTHGENTALIEGLGEVLA
ncbi:MAG: pyridoxal phosphate-dependent class II aminotransferase [Eubacteriales bacterium]|nr:pyridoxal phosphate-dependent class II aminotransferase [Eubacteriales bacterium]